MNWTEAIQCPLIISRLYSLCTQAWSLSYDITTTPCCVKRPRLSRATARFLNLCGCLWCCSWCWCFTLFYTCKTMHINEHLRRSQWQVLFLDTPKMAFVLKAHLVSNHLVEQFQHAVNHNAMAKKGVIISNTTSKLHLIIKEITSGNNPLPNTWIVYGVKIAAGGIKGKTDELKSITNIAPTNFSLKLVAANVNLPRDVKEWIHISSLPVN